MPTEKKRTIKIKMKYWKKNRGKILPPPPPPSCSCPFCHHSKVQKVPRGRKEVGEVRRREREVKKIAHI